MALPASLSSQDSPPPRKLAPVLRAGGDGAGRAQTILVAEDDADVRLMMKTLLEMKGYRVLLAENGAEAVETARADRPDLILMDLQLPRLNGFAVARFVRQNEELRAVPIVVISGHDPARHRAIALAAGCNAYVQKPINFDRLDELIANLLPV